jgi:hypothetical protein
MWYLVAGAGKSGTSALFQLIADALPRPIKIFEPRNLGEAVSHERTAEHLVAKVLIHPSKFLHPSSQTGVEQFEKRVLVLRDPRDVIVSKLLYRPYGCEFMRDDARFRMYRDALARKEADPRSISVKELTAIQLSLDGHRADMQINFPAQIIRFVRESPNQFHIFRYEDLIDKKLDALSAYLELPISSHVTLDTALSRLSRSARYGDWRHWFTEEDVQTFRASCDTFLRLFGYPIGWDLAPTPHIDPEHGTLYTDRLRDTLLKSTKIRLHTATIQRERRKIKPKAQIGAEGKPSLSGHNAMFLERLPERRLVVHIGLHKTGTTSIQRSLAADRAALMQQGIYIPRVGTLPRRGHHNLGWQLNGDPRFSPKLGTLNDLIAELESITAPTIVISTESLSSPTLRNDGRSLDLENLAKSLSRNLHIVGYVRDYASSVNSSYAEGVKTLKRGGEFSEFVGRAHESERWHYSKVFESYRRVAKNLHVLKFGGDSVASFYDAIGTKVVPRPQARLNPISGPKTIEACREIYRRYKTTGANKGSAKPDVAVSAKVIRTVATELGWNEIGFWGFAPSEAATIQGLMSDRDRQFLDLHHIEFDNLAHNRSRNLVSLEELRGDDRTEFLKAIDVMLERAHSRT